MANIIDGENGQNNIQVKLKHQRARCLLYYIQGDTSKLAQPNDQTPNKAVVDFIRRGSARYSCPHLEMCYFCNLRYHLRTRRRLLAADRNEAIPVMPFHELCELVGNAIKSVSSDAIKKSFKRTLFALPADGSRDEIDGSKRLNQLIKIAPTFEELSEAYRFNVCSIFDFEKYIICN